MRLVENPYTILSLCDSSITIVPFLKKRKNERDYEERKTLNSKERG